MKKKSLLIAALTVSAAVHAGQVDGNAVLGSMIGAGAGSAVGSAIGGKEGAIIGGGAGGAIGAAVAAKPTSSTRVVREERVVYVDDHHDHGKHKGHYKRHGHGHDRD